MEINPDHEIFIKLKDRFRRNKEGEYVIEHSELLLGYALLAEGSEIPGPTKFNRSMVDLMLKAL